MNFSKNFILKLACAFVLAGCAATAPITGETVAGSTLKADVARKVSTLAKLYAKCDRVDSLQAQVLKINPIGTGETAASIKYGSVDERWVVNLCGQSMPFLITLTPDGQGGTYFRTSQE